MGTLESQEMLNSCVVALLLCGVAHSAPVSLTPAQSACEKQLKPGVDKYSWDYGCSAPASVLRFEDDADEYCQSCPVGQSCVFSDCMSALDVIRKEASTTAIAPVNPTRFDCTSTDTRALCEKAGRNCCWDPNGEPDAMCMPAGVPCIQQAPSTPEVTVTEGASSTLAGCAWAGLIGVPVGSACDDGHRWAYVAGKAVHSLFTRK